MNKILQRVVSDRDTGPHFLEPLTFIMIRTPLLPIETLIPLGFEAANTLATIACTQPLVPHTQHDNIINLISEPIVQEALGVGARDLYESLDIARRDPETKQGAKALDAARRYLIRMSTRSTPLNLFSGVTLGSVGSTTDIWVKSAHTARKLVRPDFQWLTRILWPLEQQVDIAQHLTYFANPAMFVSGDRVYVPHADHRDQVTTVEPALSFRATPIVIRALELAKEGTTLLQLQKRLANERPDARPDQLRELLRTLCEHGALLSNLRPPLTGHDATAWILGQLRDIPGSEKVCTLLTTLTTHAQAYEAKPLGHGLSEFQALYEAVAASGDIDRQRPVSVDLAIDCDRHALSEEVAMEVARGAEALLQVSTLPQQLPYLAAYRNAFIEHYGMEREVPLLELLDEDAGLGPPPTYDHPRRSQQHASPPALRHPDRDRVLLKLATEAIRDGRTEIILDAVSLASLQVHREWYAALPDSLALFVSIAAPSQESIHLGDYRVIIAPAVGTEPAGRGLGRFANLMGPPAVQSLRDLADYEAALYPGCIVAELVYYSPYRSSANIMVRPAIRSHELVGSATPGVSRAFTIPLNDLVVGIRNDRFYLRSLSRNAEIIVRFEHVLNYYNAPNVYRFLSEIAGEGLTRLQVFDWGSAYDMPFLPRVVVGKTVLCPAQWCIPDTIIHLCAGTYRTEAYAHLQAWCTEWRIPRYAYLVMMDNKLLLDLQNPACIEDLYRACRHAAKGGPAVRIEEMLPTFDEVWAQGDDGRYIQEYVIPLRLQRPVPHTLPMASKQIPLIPPTARLHLPGGEWLYAKLYAGRSRHDALLAGPVRTLIQTAQQSGLAAQWFFIRYADPEPHLRLRIPGNQEQLRERLMPMISDWGQALVTAGHIQKLTLDTYDREVERYGGFDGIAMAEELFAIDSQAIVDIMALRAAKICEVSLDDLAMLTIERLATPFLPQAPQRLHLYRLIRQGQQAMFGRDTDTLRSAFHGYWRRSQHIVGSPDWLRQQHGGDYVLSVLERQSMALVPIASRVLDLATAGTLGVSMTSFMASCIHMHCNRLLGLDRKAEFRTMYFLERTLESLLRKHVSFADSRA